MDNYPPPLPDRGPDAEESGGVSPPAMDDGRPPFPGLLPSPVPATGKVVRRMGWVASLGASLMLLLVGAFVLGWLAGDDGSDPAEVPMGLASDQ